MSIRLVPVYVVKPSDTKEIRKALKDAGFTVKRCQLGSNRTYILIHTNDNRAARPIIEQLGYEINPIWETLHDFIFQTDKMKFERTQPRT